VDVRGIDAEDAPTARGRLRREQIIDAATALFDTKGFHGTSIDEIGASAGITGPGLYRHFAGKDEILLAVFDRIWDLLKGAIDRVQDLEPDEALDELIDTHISLAIDQGPALGLLVRELRHVPDYYQRAAERNDAHYIDTWAEVIIKLHSRLSLDEARMCARALMGLIGYSRREVPLGRISKERLREMLIVMAHESLSGF
jgi:AcrR family transcriptional regulator